MARDFLEFLKDMGIETALMISGFAGGVASVSRNKQLSFWQKSITIASGGLIANYLTPLVFDFLKLSNSTRYGIGFLVGYTGLVLVELMVKIITTRLNLSVKKPKNNEE